MTHLVIPPGANLLRVPVSNRSAFVSGLSMWSATRRPARFVQQAYRLMAVSVGPRLIPGRRQRWDVPLNPEVRLDHQERWRTWFGEWDSVAAYVPAQPDRSGVCLLLIRRGRPRGFVKVRPVWDPSGEISVISRVAGAATYWTPSVVGFHTIDDWTSLGMEPMSGKIHSPRLRSPLLAITEEISGRLTGALPGPPPRPGWQPMHGDLAPWNLRQSGPMAVAFDWEHVTYGPPGSDAVFHISASRALGYGTGSPPKGVGEAVKYWLEEIPRRFAGNERDQTMAARMLRELGRLD